MQEGDCSDCVWVIETVSKKGRSVIHSVYGDFDEAMKEVRYLVLNEKTVRVIKGEIIESFAE